MIFLFLLSFFIKYFFHILIISSFRLVIKYFNCERLIPDNNNFHSHYPVALSKTYSETRFGDLLICFRGGLTSSPLELFKTNSISDQHKAISTDRPPFCCSAMASYKNCSTAHDDLFTDLVNGRGHRSSGFCL